MSASYRFNRVIPRDLFNEAKLLKCLGQLSLVLHDGKDSAGRPLPPGLEIEFVEPEYAEGFRVVQNPADGGLSCAAVRATFNGHPVRLFSVYNSRDNFPLWFEAAVAGVWVEGPVFNETGYLSPELLALS